MTLKERACGLGLGSCGGKQAKELMVSYGFKIYTANGSGQDLKALGNVPKYQLEGFDGFGGHRERALDCLAQNDEFMSYVENIEEDIVFVLFGGGGSTGSGCAPILSELLLEKKDEEGKPVRTVCPVITLPAADEPIIKHKNAYQAVQELQNIEGLGATFFLNNDSGKSYEDINAMFAKFLDTFLSNDSYGKLNNFDESERMEMLRDGGAMVLGLNKAGTEPDAALERLTVNGIFVPIERNAVCEHIAIIHAGNDNADIMAEDVIAAVGKPSNVFEGYNGRSTLIAVSGLDYPVSHVMKLGELAKTAYEERERSRKSVKMLADLSFGEESTVTKKVEEKPKKKTMFELMKERKAKM